MDFRGLMPYKHLKKFVFAVAVLFMLYTIHNIVLQGNNLYTNSGRREIWINSLGRNTARKSNGLNTLTRVFADGFNEAQNKYLGSDHIIISLLSSETSANASTLHNRTHRIYVPIDKLKQLQSILNETNLANNKSLDYKPDFGTDADKANDTLSRTKHSDLQNDAGNANGTSEKSSEVNSHLEDIEDDDNEFDITDLDDHITFPKRKRKNNKEVPSPSRNNLKWNGSYDMKLKNTLQYRKQIQSIFKRPIQNQAGIDCKKIVENNDDEVMKAKHIMKKFKRRGVATDKYTRTSDCENFKGGRGYIEHPLSQKELDFPLAFEISAYRDVEQAERLLRAIYRPHNFYCFHLDLKLKQQERIAFERIVRCFDNVFIADRSVNVTWGTFSVLEAELLCLQKLWQYKRWKYYINLTGQEFPLKTNREIVAILDSLDGANIVDGTWIRARHGYFNRWTMAGHPPPHRIRPIKGSLHVAINRQFVDFALHDKRSLDFLEWLKKTSIPDETFFSSLNHNPHLGINGSFLGEAEEYPLKPSLMRYKNWELGRAVFVRECAGKYVRHICILGIGDLHKAYDDIGLFVNKLNIDFEYLALDCLEELMYKRTWEQYINDVTIDTNYYKHLDYVKKKLFVPPKKEG